MNLKEIFQNQIDQSEYTGPGDMALYYFIRNTLCGEIKSVRLNESELATFEDELKAENATFDGYMGGGQMPRFLTESYRLGHGID